MKTLHKNGQYLKHIEMLELHGQTNVPFRNLTLLKNIKTLKLVNCQVNSFIWPVKKPVESLRHLILIDTPLADYSELLKLNSLEKLTMNDKTLLKDRNERCKSSKK